MRRWTLLIAALSALVGCVERAPELSPADRERLREYVGTERPSPEHALDVQFENGVSLLGYDVEPDTATPGQPFTITWHWHARQDLDDGWALFTHVADAAGENRLNQDGVGVVRELYQPGRWEAGQYIRDVQQVTLPNDWNSNRADFYLGLWNGPHRLAIRRGPNDGDNRVRAASVEVSSAPSAARAVEEPAPAEEAPRIAPPPAVTAVRAAEPITVDGNLDEPAWNRAGRTARFVDTLGGGAAQLRANARVLWDDDHLYVAFEVADDFLQNTIAERDGHLWEQDAVEIMIDPDGDGRNYFEMQVSPTGQVFDTRYDTRRQPQPFGEVAWDSRLRAGVSPRGTVNDAQDDNGYTAEIAIPWRAFRAGTPPASRPEAGQTWRANFYVMDQRRAGQGQRTAGWSPTHERDFHVPARFGQITFQGDAPEPAQVAEAPAARVPAVPEVALPRLQIRPEAAAALREQLGRGTVRNPTPVERRRLQAAANP